MKLTLMGPDDEGCWFLSESTGREFKIVEKREDHAYAAKLFGWSPSSESLATDELNEEAREFLMEHIGEEITAPAHIAEHFAR
jgi:hypothetical protein